MITNSEKKTSTKKQEETKPEIDATKVLRDIKKLKELTRHIRNVQEGAYRIAEHMIEHGESEFAQTLVANSMVHDQSKFRGIEWDFIGAADCENPDDRHYAINQHQRTNSHHPEYWSGGIHKMPEIYIAEMVCDWYARSVEMGTDLRDWAKNKAPERFGFTLQQNTWKLIKKYVDIILQQPFD